ncbi:MAG TPA: endonuclease III [bacterium]|nr:endonuclease III [bacterium]HPS29488.1 endonuclease III [bacterium]
MKPIPVKKTFLLLSKWADTIGHVPIIDLMAAGGDSPWKILVSTMLSARTKDSTTAKASRTLFAVSDTPQKTAELSVKELEKLIYPVGFYKTKAENLHALTEIILKKYKGQVPETVEELITLPGIGIKTASLVFIKAFDGFDICVDTHVHRISNMWNLVKTDTPEKTRIELKKVIPKKYWKEINQYIVTLGQTICRPMKRECDKCPLNKICPASSNH